MHERNERFEQMPLPTFASNWCAKRRGGGIFSEAYGSTSGLSKSMQLQYKPIVRANYTKNRTPGHVFSNNGLSLRSMCSIIFSTGGKF